MPTTILDPMPPEVEALIRRRRELGQDLYDEVWQGDYHMVPGPHSRHGDMQRQLLVLLDEPTRRAGLLLLGAFNLGTKDDFRVPDAGAVRAPADQLYLSTAVLVVEVLSEGDETYRKFDFYHRHDVRWILVADPAAAVVEIWQRAENGYRKVEEIPDIASRAYLENAIQWP